MATHVLVVVLLLLVLGTEAAAQPGVGELEVVVRSEGRPLTGAIVKAGLTVAKTDQTGTVRLDVAAGKTTVAVEAEGFLTATYDVEIDAAGTRRIEVDLVEVPEIEEEVVVVATTRTGRRLDDQPTRVEVLDREEIEEKMLMTPGDIVMMLNEMGGLRVQATSPSLGAASVRVQGMKGRYTRFLSDGLPLFGQQVGGLGLLQVPPIDLGRVEVIKGAASALYGAGAMSGVVNLLARRPETSPWPRCWPTCPRWARPTPSCSSPRARDPRVERVRARGRARPGPQQSRRRWMGGSRSSMRAAWSGRGCSGMAGTAARCSSRPGSPSRTVTGECPARRFRPPACRTPRRWTRAGSTPAAPPRPC